MQHTACASHSPPPTPITVIGEHVNPTRTSKSCNTIPSKANKALASAADSVDWQHCMGPVEHEVGAGAAVVVVAEGLGAARADEATARMTRKAKKKRWMEVNCILSLLSS